MLGLELSQETVLPVGQRPFVGAHGLAWGVLTAGSIAPGQAQKGPDPACAPSPASV